jgi:hypothetical protein
MHQYLDRNKGTKGRKRLKPIKAFVEIVIPDPQALSTVTI